MYAVLCVVVVPFLFVLLLFQPLLKLMGALGFPPEVLR